MHPLPGSRGSHRASPTAQLPADADTIAIPPDGGTARSGGIGSGTCVCDRPARRLSPSSAPQYLPALVLNKIASYLPLSAQCCCARVCRHWHDCLPAPELRLSGWLQQHAPLSWLANPHLGLGFDSRIRPFLQATNSPVLPALEHLLQQEQRPSGSLQDVQQFSHAPPANPLVSRLVHYGLNQQLTRADQLCLRTADIDWPEGVPSRFHFFSPCSRWLAILSQPQPEAPLLLRLYGWEQGVWRQQLLVPGNPEHVDICRFPSRPPDRLIVAQGLDVLVWRKVPGTRDWRGSPLWSVPDSHTLRNIYTMDNGDLVILTYGEQAGPGILVQFFLYGESDNSWTPATTATYTGLPLCWSWQEQSCQLAVSEYSRPAGHDHRITEIHVWHRTQATEGPEAWEPQTWVLPCHDVCVWTLNYSPGGHCLLGQLSDGRTCLWTLDTQHRLQQQLTLPGYQLQPDLDEGSTPFSRDARQLALSCSLHQIQLCYSDENNHWQYGQLLEAPIVPGVPANDRLLEIMLSPSGRTLVRVTLWHIDIWHRDTAGHWAHQVQRTRTANARFFPTACLMEPGELVCTTAQDPELSLWIHGPDRQGRLVRKACMRVEAPSSRCTAVTADGLSLLLSTAVRPPTLLQLSPPEHPETSGRAAPAPEPVARRHHCCLL